MPGWGKLVAGALIGVAGTVYATNSEVRKRLPKGARDLPDAVRNRFRSSVEAARDASRRRREEILRELERHEAAERAASTAPPVRAPEDGPPEDGPPEVAVAKAPEPGPDDATRSMPVPVTEESSRGREDAVDDPIRRGDP